MRNWPDDRAFRKLLRWFKNKGLKFDTDDAALPISTYLSKHNIDSVKTIETSQKGLKKLKSIVWEELVDDKGFDPFAHVDIPWTN